MFIQEEVSDKELLVRWGLAFIFQQIKKWQLKHYKKRRLLSRLTLNE